MVRKPRILTIGYSDNSIDLFISLLERSSVRLVADIRPNPSMSRFPNFERHALAKELEKRGLSYRWFRTLGGQVFEPGKQELHTALGNENDKQYAAAMNTVEFTKACRELIGLSASAVVAVMSDGCKTEVCHRRLLSDKLVTLGIRVVHILGSEEGEEHGLHPGLEVKPNGNLVYTQKQLSLI